MSTEVAIGYPPATLVTRPALQIRARGVTAPAPVRTLRQRQGRHDPALSRSLTTQGRSVCPGQSTVTLGISRLVEHTGALGCTG